MAATLLTMNTNNRPIRAWRVVELEHMMESGQFEVTGDAIQVSKCGVLMNSQHRLKAIVNTNLSQRMTLVTGLDKSVYKVIDQGIARSTGDILSASGVKNCNRVAAIGGLLLRHERCSSMTIGLNRRYSKGDISDFCLSRPALLASANFIGTNRELAVIFKPGFLGLLHYIFSEIDEASARIFFEKVNDGVGCDRGDPELVLRNTLLKMITKPALKQDPPIVKAALCIFAWNAFRGGRKIKTLRWSIGGENPQKFPRAK